MNQIHQILSGFIRWLKNPNPETTLVNWIKKKAK